MTLGVPGLICLYLADWLEIPEEAFPRLQGGVLDLTVGVNKAVPTAVHCVHGRVARALDAARWAHALQMISRVPRRRLSVAMIGAWSIPPQ